jgi:hypothetical protein
MPVACRALTAHSHPNAATTRKETMLLQLITTHPEAIVQIVQKTPMWVWGLLAALLALGASQLRDRRASLVRITVMPLAMTAFSLWGTVSAFSASPLFGEVMLAWFAVSAAMVAIVAPGTSAATYDADTRSFAMPGSWVPMALILGIFLTKYVVGVEMAMQPQLARDGQFTLVVGALYGAFSGIFTGRAARLWRLAFRPTSPALAA